VNGRRRNPELLCQSGNPAIFAGDISRPNFSDNCLIKKGHRVRFSRAVVSSVLSIDHVIGWRSGIQVIGIYTRRVIALVKNAQAFRNRTVSTLERDYVCSTNSGKSVTVFIGSTKPQPTSAGLVDLLPESIKSAFPVSRVVAGLRAKFSDIASPANERLRTLLTDGLSF